MGQEKEKVMAGIMNDLTEGAEKLRHKAGTTARVADGDAGFEILAHHVVSREFWTLVAATPAYVHLLNKLIMVVKANLAPDTIRPVTAICGLEFDGQTLMIGVFRRSCLSQTALEAVLCGALEISDDNVCVLFDPALSREVGTRLFASLLACKTEGEHRQN